MWTLEATVVVSIALWSKEWNPLHRVCTEGWVWKPWDWAQLIDCLVLFVTSIYHRTKWSVCFLHFHKQWEDSALLEILLYTQVHRLEYLVQVGHIINSHIFFFFLVYFNTWFSLDCCSCSLFSFLSLLVGVGALEEGCTPKRLICNSKQSQSKARLWHRNTRNIKMATYAFKAS